MDTVSSSSVKSYYATLPPTEDHAELLRRSARAMIAGRQFETKVANLYRAGKIVGGVYTGKGQEAFSAAMGACLHPEDIYAPLIRDAAGRSAFGEPFLDAMRTYLGSVEGPMRGRDGNVHRGRPKEGMVAMISHLGSTFSVVNGMLLARRMQGKAGVGAVVIGDGGTSTGAFHEALNQAAVMKLPVVVAVANNLYAYSTPNSSQFACEDLYDRAVGYGVAGHRVEAGNSLLESAQVMREAFAAARRGEGPQLVVGKLLRLSGHGEHDDAHYVKECDRQSPWGRDCLEIAREELVEKGVFTEQQWQQMTEEIVEEIQQAQSKASREDNPDPYKEDWKSLVGSYFSS